MSRRRAFSRSLSDRKLWREAAQNGNASHCFFLCTKNETVGVTLNIFKIVKVRYYINMGMRFICPLVVEML